MITEDYVSFEIAKLLKEKGFNIPCRTNYRSKYSSDKRPFLHNSPKDFNGKEYEGLNSEWFSAPTLQMVMKWLRVVHRLEIYPFHDAIQECNTWWYRIEKHTKGCGLTEHESDSMYFTYEEACNAAIKYCLENLV